MRMWTKKVLSIVASLSIATGFASCSYEPPGTVEFGGAANGGELDCLNGFDDDEDGYVDCADADCDPGYECASNAPTGFSEPVRIALVPSDNQVVVCDTDGAMPDFVGINATTPDCTDCQCKLLDVNCRREIVDFYSAAGCPGSPTETVVASSECMTVPTSSLAGSYQMRQGDVTGSFTITAAVKTPESPWKDVGYVCRAYKTTGTGCGEGRFCIPRAREPFESGVCVEAVGNAECNGDYTRKIVGFTNADDSRTCSNCMCKASVSCTGYTADFNSDGTCTGNKTQTGQTSCSPVPSGSLSLALGKLSWTEIKTEAVGGLPMGNVMPQNARTFCCTK